MKFNNVLVFDDLMLQATESLVLSKLFTQGRHRNASVILLLQNMFPKGKFNTDISRNAQYMVLFCSPSDRKEIDIIAERIFTKDCPNFMSMYGSVTAKPYRYILIDNQPKTTSEKQVVANVFGHCYAYPHIAASTHSVPEVTQGTPETESWLIEPSEVKHKGPNQSAKKSKVSGKREIELKKLPAKRKRTETKQTKWKQSKPAKKQAKVKQETKKPCTLKMQRKPCVYKLRFIVTPPRETLSSEEEEFNSEAEPFSSEDESLNASAKYLNFQDELNSLARQHKGFSPKIMYE